VVCWEPGCRYRVYGRKCDDQEVFEIRSIQAKHTCTRQHRISAVKSPWIAHKLIDKFRAQSNMPLKAILGEVKEKWGVDVDNWQLHRARRIVKEILQDKVKLQYARLCDYCETVRQTNQGSCLMMKVERHLPDHPACFHRLYFSLAAMKRGFQAGCWPIIGLDGCFLKGPYKGQLLSVISRDGNNNMYPVAIAVVEAETKDSWIWFLESFLESLLAVNKT
jgi:zinc finger SWIM domain-containing protein 3